MTERQPGASETGPSPPEARRESRHILAAFEARVLPRIAAALPRVVLPDHLTALGVLSAFAIGACYAL